MLPGVAGHRNLRRAERIGRLLDTANYDVIVFQEAFSKKARQVISRYLLPAFPFQMSPVRQGGLTMRLSNGIWILSKHPILQTGSITYRHRKGIDALAQKGASLVTLQIGHSTIQIVGTHLQNSAIAWTKVQQYHELERLLRVYHNDNVPQIICGDFNIHAGNDGLYANLLSTLQVTDGMLNSPFRFSYDGRNNDLCSGSVQELIDHILLRTGNWKAVTNERSILRPHQQWHQRHKDLSDHYPVEAVFRFSPSKPQETAGLMQVPD
ncbi:MAG: endonuclease/exonuclease/phosphatase family protein [Bacteroidetes bacterium]|nr:endonuclease/exonuclease/phosphatase family protein [Bacteroidota bacterium]